MTLPPTERTPPRDDDDDDHDGGGRTPDASLAREAEQRYLTYALSVITSRALPDVRDGLKPVQRRILHAMLADLALRPDGRFRKSAAVVGEVLGKYHPHGDTAVYDAMVRMAQPFAMRHPLVSGQGNFGSPDGDAAAAMRYTEAKLAPIALELLAELGQETVGFRDNYDGTRTEPVVLPSRYPNLLVNGSYGIAVGMATSIPPHNLREVIDACVALIDAGDEPLSTAKLLRYVKGPDFPTGAELMANRAQLREIYEYGHGSLKLRGTYTHQPGKRRGDDDRIVITSMPYTVERHVVVEKIAEAVVKKKLPMVLDVRDESTDEVRVVLDLKRGSDPHLVMAYVFKHTPLQTNVNFNLTCLVPVGGFGGDHAAPAANASAPHDDDALTTPARLGLAELLRHFLDFRLETVTRRLRYALRKLQERIHILEGLEIIFDALDQAIRIIRRSDGRADAATKLMGRFGLSDVQAGAVLDLRLYRLSKLEILAIRRELAEKRAEAKRIRGLLKSTAKRWALVRDELVQVKNEFGHKRATRIVAGVEEPEYGAEDFIVAEDATVILMTSGWLKRVGQVKDVNKTRMRDGDRVLAAVAGSTKSCVAFFSNQGACYVTRIHDVPASTGYGEPIQSLFKLGDGERIVSMLSFDPRRLEVLPSNPEATEPEPPYALAVTRRGYGLRFSLAGHAEPSTRAGRKFARPAKGDEVLTVLPLGSYQEDDYVMCASDDGHAIAVLAEDVSLLSGPGKGVLVIKLAPGVSLLGAELGHRDLDQITVSTRAGKVRHLTLRSLVGSRGGKGSAVVKRGGFAEYHQRPVETPRLDT
ncbi:MAG: DNA topoisomerase IV subunit A [Myxococcota bacterium]